MIKPHINALTGGDWVRIGIISLLFVIVYTQVYDKKISILGDNAAYYTLAKGISEGFGFSNYASPTRAPHNHFPPGYPFFIAIFMKLFSDNIQFIKILNGVLTLGALVLTYLLAVRLNFNKILALFIPVAVAMNVEMLYYSSIMMSEIVFMFTSLLIFFFLSQADFKKQFYKEPYFYLSLIFIIYSFYTRAFGIAILGAVVVYFLYRKKFYYVGAYIVGFMVGVLPWQIRSYSMGGSNQFNVLFRKNYYRPESGTIDVSDMFTRVYENFIRIIPTELPNAIFPFLKFNTTDSNIFVQWIVGLIIVVAMAYAAKKLKDIGLVLSLYMLFNFLILLIWPDYFSSARYLAPLIPVIGLLFFYGAFTFIDVRARKIYPGLKFNPYLLFVVLLFYVSSVKELSTSVKQNYPKQWAEYFAMAKWTAENVESDAVICSRKPNLFYLYSKHLTTNYKYTEDPEELIAGLEKSQVDYVVYDQLGFSTTPRCLGKAIKEKEERFELVQYVGSKENPTYLFKFK